MAGVNALALQHRGVWLEPLTERAEQALRAAVQHGELRGGALAPSAARWCAACAPAKAQLRCLLNKPRPATSPSP